MARPALPDAGAFFPLDLPVDWTSLETALEGERPVLLILGASWCPYSQRFLHWLGQDAPALRTLEASFHAVLIDTEARPDLYRRYGAGGWPSVVILGRDGRPRWRGLHVPRGELDALLRAFAHDTGGGTDPPGHPPPPGWPDILRVAVRVASGPLNAPPLHLIRLILDAADLPRPPAPASELRTIATDALLRLHTTLWRGGLMRVAGRPEFRLADTATFLVLVARAAEATADARLQRASFDVKDGWALLFRQESVSSIRPPHPEVPEDWPLPAEDPARLTDATARLDSVLGVTAGVPDPPVHWWREIDRRIWTTPAGAADYAALAAADPARAEELFIAAMEASDAWDATDCAGLAALGAQLARQGHTACLAPAREAAARARAQARRRDWFAMAEAELALEALR